MSHRRQKLLASTLLSVAFVSTIPFAAHAQDEASTTVQEVVVTGSRIARINTDSPVPVTVIDDRIIEGTGAINTGDLLRTLPAAGVSGFTAQNTNFATAQNGVVTVDLRNLGEDRTLVLLNGRRYVAGVPGSQVVDFSTIPPDLISRVEVVTGGASAVYGSDALAGVINIITKKNFEGLAITGQYGISERGDDEKGRFNLTAGKNFGDGVGNAVFSIGYSKVNPIFARDRKDHGMAIDAINAFDGTNASIADQIAGGFSSYSEFGRIEIPTKTGGVISRVFDNGQVVPYTGAAFGFNRQSKRILQVPSEQLSVAGQFYFNIVPHANLFSEFNFVHTDLSSEIEAFPLDSADVYGDLAFCDDFGGTGAITCQNGIPLLSAIVPEPIRAATRAVNPGIADQDLVVGFRRRLTDVQLRGTVNERQTFRTVVGLEGTFSPRLNYEVSVNYGRTDDDQETKGDVDLKRFKQGLDTITLNGQIVCADPAARAAGCAPINIFGFNTISKEAADYVRVPSTRDAAIEQFVVNGFIRGDIFTLPAGPVGYVLGSEYRQEKSRDTPDALTQSGQSSGNLTPETKGKFDVTEFFGELRVPLLSDRRWVDRLDLNLAARTSDYSTAGRTDAWAASLEYAPTDWLKLRTQYARAVRAPNISELFSPALEDFPSVNDPCAGVTLSGGSPAFFNTRVDIVDPSNVLSSGIDTSSVNSTLAKNCLADPSVAARVAKSGGFAITQAEQQGTSGLESGNPNLNAETANTFTVGAVFNPRWNDWWSGLSISVDYYDIEIKDRILQLDQDLEVLACYSSSGGFDPTNTFCSQIHRFATGPQVGAIDRADNVYANTGSTKTRGLDIQATYRLALNRLPYIGGTRDLGTLTANLNWTNLFQLETLPFAGAPEEDIIRNVGAVGSPRNEANLRLLYDRGPLELFWNVDYIGKGVIHTNPSSDYFNARIPQQDFHNAQVRWKFQKHLTGYFGVDNIFDRYVMVGGTNGLVSGVTVSQTTGWTTFPEVYDGVGRRYYVGLKAQF